MGIKILKVLSVGIILFLFYEIYLLGCSTLTGGKHLINPYIDTRFAPDYSPEKFDKIKVGMTLDEVESIIGKPIRNLTDFFDSTKIRYHYTDNLVLADKNAKWEQKQEKGYYDYPPLYPSCLCDYRYAWYCSSITFDKNNIVVEIYKEWLYY